jgi:hypothetical protein
MDRDHGFFLNEVDPRSGEALILNPIGSRPRRGLVSAVDNAWLAAALMMVANTQPQLRDRADKLLQSMDFQFFYDAFDPADRVHHPGLLRVGYWPHTSAFYGHYGMLNSEARIASYLGIAQGQLPPDHYYRMFRTLPNYFGAQEQIPQGIHREYLGVEVFEGAYSYRGARIVPTWGGSMFEALMVTLFVPEDVWAPRSWGVNHPLYVRAQMQHGMEDAQYGFWGFSPAVSPRGEYRVYGLNALGSSALGYVSYEPDIVQLPPVVPATTRSKVVHGVVAPYASFLALRYLPKEAMANLRALAARFPVYGPLGFHDSVDVTAGIVSGSVLAVDQGMIMAAIANELADDAIQHAFSDGAVEKSIRALIEIEEFTAGAPVQTARGMSRAQEPSRIALERK